MKRRVAKNLVERISKELAEIEAMVVPILGEQKAKVWMKVPNLNLGGSSPEALVAANRGHKVVEFIKASKGIE